jgi:poly-gamma-glutamate synthesis protein (capsule biosynthesis protein)
MAVAVAAAALVTAGWATRDDGRAAPAQGHPITPPVHSEGQVETVPLDGAAPPEPPAVPEVAPSATAGAPATVTTTARKAAPPTTVPAKPAPAAPAAPAPTLPAGFSGSVFPIDDATAARMTSSWRPGCPVGLSDLRRVTLTHWGFDGQPRSGEIVVHRDQADRILGVFAAVFEARFPLEQVRLIDEFGGDDNRSMAANNTSGFNCRYVAGTRRWSQHAFGRAIDVNPVQNPYVRGNDVSPPEGRPYVRRDGNVPGLITADGPVVAAFSRARWLWGGRWASPDYQHFSSSGR